MKEPAQKIIVFQQNGSAETKIAGIRDHGRGLVLVEPYSIDTPLPSVIDDSSPWLPETLHADLALDFLSHPDLSEDLCETCRRLGIPVVASGKKHRMDGVICPPT